MNEWLREKLREKLEAWIPFFTVLTIVIGGISFGVLGAILFEYVGFFIGVIIGVTFSFVVCVFWYGYVATVISIANSTEKNMELLAEIKLHVSDAKRETE